ncbi:MAG: ribonuclease P protein component [Desulfobacterales bacterium]
MGFSFRKSDRIRKRSEFLALDAEGRRVAVPWFLAVFAPSPSGRPRLGITVSRRIGRAVERNRIRRVVREFFRLHRQMLGGAWDVHVIARRGAAEQTNRVLFAALRELFEKIARAA